MILAQSLTTIAVTAKGAFMRRLTLLGLPIAALAFSIPGALARADKTTGTSATPGVTSKNITIGGTFPLTGRRRRTA